MTSYPSLLSVLLVLFAFAGSGCASLRVQVLQPAYVNLGRTEQLSVVQATGRRSKRELIIDELERQARDAGFFAVEDRTDEGIEIKLIGGSAETSGGTRDQLDIEAYLRIDLLEWQADTTRRTQSYRDDNDRERVRTIDMLVGRVVFAVTTVNWQGRALMAENDYEQVHEVQLGEMSEDRVVFEAARRGVRLLLRQITPTWHFESIRWDSSDKTQKEIYKVAKQGNRPYAEELMREYLSADPGNSVAQYNLAVILDAQGRYPGALQLYDQAMKGGAKGFYANSRAACARRLAASKAMAE